MSEIRLVARFWAWIESRILSEPRLAFQKALGRSPRKCSPIISKIAWPILLFLPKILLQNFAFLTWESSTSDVFVTNCIRNYLEKYGKYLAKCICWVLTKSSQFQYDTFSIHNQRLQFSDNMYNSLKISISCK